MSGATMLSKHCKICNFPLFEKNGVEYCPNCKNNEENNIKTTNKNNIKSINDDNKYLKDIKYSAILNNKIDFLCNLLEKETDLDKIHKISQLILNLLELSEKLSIFEKK
uniref:Sjogrens syndrome scleroderma autoantigen 1 n=2 Tax=Methanococcus voltae TaxID=2188 RepID=D7DV31_METV3